MKAMIIDDEPPARRELRRLLADFSWVDVVGEAGNVDQAEVDALDYLLKPIDPARLAAALARVKIAHSGRAPVSKHYWSRSSSAMVIGVGSCRSGKCGC
jgi:DNA-binding LytR/AlgR family response regulator